MSASKYFWRPIDLVGCHLLGKRFVGGFSIPEVLRTGEELKSLGYRVSYNLLGEHVGYRGVVFKTTETILNLMGAMNSENRGNVVIKPTQCGLEISPDLFHEEVEKIVLRGREIGIETEFDAEHSRYVEDAFRVFHELASKFHYAGFMRQCVQAHLKALRALMDKYNLWKMNLRVVEGSQVYPELAGVVFEDREQILEQYCYILRRNHAEGKVPYVATVRDRRKVNAAKKILPSPFMVEFQMLYNDLPFGLFGRELGEELIEGRDLREGPGGLDTGWPVRIYIPFVVPWCKDAWKEYGLRRSAMMRRLMWEELKYRGGGK